MFVSRMGLSILPESSAVSGFGRPRCGTFDGTLHFVPNRNITVVSNLSRGDMRVLVDIPLDANTDLDKIYQVIAQVNQSQQDKHPEVLTGPTILGPQIEKNGRYSFRIVMTAQNGTQTTVYHTYYKLYHDALMEAGINLTDRKETGSCN